MKEKNEDMQIQEILGEWELQIYESRCIQEDVWEVGEQYILKAYDNIDLLEKNVQIVKILSELKVPVARVLLTKAGKECQAHI